MNARHYAAVLITGATLVLPPCATGKLVFEQPVQTVEAKWADTEASAVYKFTNTGPETVKITGIQPSCGCTVATLAKDVYAPGEKGEVRLRFAFDGRSGQARETAQVLTDLPSQPSEELTIQTVIPRVLDFAPQMVYWKPGEPREPKTVDVTLPPDLPFGKLETSPADGNFEVALKEITHATHYELVITPVPHTVGGNVTNPAGDGQPTRGQFVLTLHFAGEQTRTGTVYALLFPGAAVPPPAK
jgi:hypothetical protein